MLANYLKSITALLAELKPLQPIATGLEAKFEHNPNLKCVVFDVYGTLVVSSSGDIRHAKLRPEHFIAAFKRCNIQLTSATPKPVAEYILEEYKNLILAEQSKIHRSGVALPEVNICEIWLALLTKLHANHLINHFSPLQVKQLAMTFEFISNPATPMPNFKKVLRQLHKKEYPLGIISNAQFYTPMMLNFFLTGKVYDNTAIKLINHDLAIFSYQERRAKPDLSLFQKVISRAYQDYQIEPCQILYIGNDIHNDIEPAKLLGMQTALFAGDNRSLRINPKRPIEADYVITDLEQILEIVP